MFLKVGSYYHYYHLVVLVFLDVYQLQIFTSRVDIKLQRNIIEQTRMYITEVKKLTSL